MSRDLLALLMAMIGITAIAWWNPATEPLWTPPDGPCRIAPVLPELTP